jgi:hypothetical protein
MGTPFYDHLIIGRQQIVLNGNMGMQVDELQRTAGSLTLLDPSSLQLVAGGITLRPGSVLGDYPATWSPTCVGPQGLHVTVFSRPERDPTLPPHETFQASLRINNASPNPFQWGVNGETRVAESVCTLAPSSMRFRVEQEGVQSARAESTRSLQEAPAHVGRPGESSHLIWLIYEDGRTVSQVVWGTMLVRELCIRIGEFASVSPDTVFCYYAGAILDVERRIDDAPAIGTGAQVHVFFTIGNALSFVVQSMQGGGTPPPTTPPPTPPSPPPFGPPVPPGFRCAAPAPHAPASERGFTAAQDRGSASDRLRNIFKCPKFVGDSRHWKV